MSVFALTVADAWCIAEITGGYDVNDAYSRHNPATAPAALPAAPRLAVPDPLTFFDDSASEAAFAQALALLYDDPDSLELVVREIIARGNEFSACDAWQAEYLRAELTRAIHLSLQNVDALVVPTSPTIRTLAEMAREPVRYNAQFGTYTNFTNLADLCALELPAGITLIAPAWHDRALAEFGRRLQYQHPQTLGVTGRALPTPSPDRCASRWWARISATCRSMFS